MRSRLLTFTSIAALMLAGANAYAAAVILVYKSPYCGCCSKWVQHLQENGFTVKAVDVKDVSEYRRSFDVPEALGSCHTARIEGYAIEGHVPAKEIKRLLAERPKAKGLAVPSMPPGSPSMEGSRSDQYAVLLFDASGKYSIYQKY